MRLLLYTHIALGVIEGQTGNFAAGLRRLIGDPDDMGVAPDGKLWIAMRFAETVAVMDPESGVYESIDVGRSPHGIFLNTELRKAGKVTVEVL